MTLAPQPLNVNVQPTGTTRTSLTPSEELNNLLNFLRMEVECRDKGDNGRDGLKGLSEPFRSTPSVAMLHAATRNEYECCFCRSRKHNRASCDNEMPFAEKKKRLVKENKCFRCITKGHGARQCHKKVVSCDGEETLTDRKRMLAKDARCFRCTTKGHTARQKYKNVKCAKCNGGHMAAMCDQKYIEKE